MRRTLGLAVLMTAMLAACGGDGGPTGSVTAAADTRRSTASAAPTTPGTKVRSDSNARARCHVTHPNGRTAPGERPSQSFYGRAGLWTLLPADGVLRITSATPVPVGATGGTVHADGSLSTKFPWWGSRAASGRLSIRAKRLDRHARRLRLTVGPGSSARAPHFWPSRLRFATPGCWQVDARSGRAHLTFLLSVQAAHN